MNKVEKAKKVLEQNGYLARYWHELDIQHCAGELGLSLTGEQLKNIKTVLKYVDPNLGINYETIKTAIENEVL